MHAEGAIRSRSLFASPPYEKRLYMPKEWVGKAKRLPMHGHCGNRVMPHEPVLNRI